MDSIADEVFDYHLPTARTDHTVQELRAPPPGQVDPGSDFFSIMVRARRGTAICRHPLGIYTEGALNRIPTAVTWRFPA